MEARMKQIDGGLLEGGGQIFRNCSSLACLLRVPFRIDNIRGGRGNAGLRPQHLSGLQLVCQLCKGEMRGGQVGSASVEFFPGPSIVPQDFNRIDIGTAGSISLLLQTALPCLAFASKEARTEFIGGTDTEHTPPIDAMSRVFKPYAQKFGFNFDIKVQQRGYFPQGGGRILLHSMPVKFLNSVELTDRGRILRVVGRSWVAGKIPGHVAATCRDVAVLALKSIPVLADAEINVDAVVESKISAPIGTGNGIELYAETANGCVLSSTVMGRKGYRAEQTASDAVDKLAANFQNGECLDSEMQNQVIILMALAKGHSKFRTGPPTMHTKTAILIAEQMTDSAVKFSHEPANDGLGGYILEATGIGLENINMP